MGISEGGSAPARTGRQRQWAQVNPECPQPGGLAEAEPPPRDPVRTLTELKLRSASVDPHSGQVGVTPSAYADMDILFSKGCPHFRHT
jgi:hypothetical protein